MKTHLYSQTMRIINIVKYCYQHSGTADVLDPLRVDKNVSQQLNNCLAN